MNFSHAMKLGLAATLVSSVVWSAGLASAQTSAGKDATKTASKETPKEETTKDTLIFRNGNVLVGTIVSESDTGIRFKTEVNGIPLETEYSRDLILEVKRATKKADAKEADKAEKKADAKATPALTEKKDDVTQTENTGPRYYVVPLRGTFGGDTSLRSLRLIMDDVKKQKADIVIFDLNVWSRNARTGEDAGQFTQNFQAFNAAQPMMNLLTEQLPADWGGPMPRMVFAVRDAWGGAACLPFTSNEVYFFPDARMGGIGGMTYEAFGGGSTRVLEKWMASLTDQLTGYLITSKWPFHDEIVRAMLRPEYVLSLRFVDGKPQVFEDYPSDPSEELLTDAGGWATDKGRADETDDIVELARFQGNDHLTLTAPLALKLGVSKGTVTSINDVLSQLGVAQTGVDVGKNAKNIMEKWGEQWQRAAQKITRVWADYQDVQVQAPGGFEERSAARGKRIRILEDLKSTIRQFDGGIPMYVYQRAQLPIGEDGRPNIAFIDDLISQIKEDQRRDRR
ncbi:MAG TPA: hypothetical protein VK157_06940 [Phycisphaerales bacterium]|nr:hypothetical protein [Phycisphaerales bacterium]